MKPRLLGTANDEGLGASTRVVNSLLPPQQHRAGVDLHAEQYVRLLRQAADE
jgi:hypothetical protein